MTISASSKFGLSLPSAIGRSLHKDCTLSSRLFTLEFQVSQVRETNRLRCAIVGDAKGGYTSYNVFPYAGAEALAARQQVHRRF